MATESACSGPDAEAKRFNADEAIWGWSREEVAANRCFGTVAKALERLDALSPGLADRVDEVKRRCRTVLPATADARADPRGACRADPLATCIW